MEREARYTAGGNERRTQGGDVGWDQQRLTGDLLLGAVLVSDLQSPSGAGRGRSGLYEGRGQGMWRLSHWKYLLVECDTQCKKSPDSEGVGVAWRLVHRCLAGVYACGGISFLFS